MFTLLGRGECSGVELLHEGDQNGEADLVSESVKLTWDSAEEVPAREQAAAPASPRTPLAKLALVSGAGIRVAELVVVDLFNGLGRLQHRLGEGEISKVKLVVLHGQL